MSGTFAPKRELLLKQRPRLEAYEEIIGGSQHVESNDLLKAHRRPQPPLAAFQWYLDLRKCGSVSQAASGWESKEP